MGKGRFFTCPFFILYEVRNHYFQQKLAQLKNSFYLSTIYLSETIGNFGAGANEYPVKRIVGNLALLDIIIITINHLRLTKRKIVNRVLCFS